MTNLGYNIGACISILDTSEQSTALSGDNDWTEIELCFNSRERESVNICFRLGGYKGEAKGTAWFSDIQVEKTTDTTDEWNVVCFMIDNIDVTLNGTHYSTSLTSYDKELINDNLSRFASTMEEFSEGKMDVYTEIVEITEPLTTLSYNTENYYYIQPEDAYSLIKDYVAENEYDHIFIAVRMGDTNVEIPVNEWIGLGRNEI